MILDGKAPTGPVENSWNKYREDQKLVNPSNKRKYKILVVGSGLAGGAGAASLGELGYNVDCFCYQDSPRRAHSIGAQGGINAAKSYPSDGDSIYRLFYDTVKGGDFRSREADVWRLAQVSNNIIDQCVWRRASLLPVIMLAILTTVLSVAHRFPGHSTLVAKLVSSCCSVLTRH